MFSVVAYTVHIVVDFYSCLNRSSDFILYLVRIFLMLNRYLYKLGYLLPSPSYFTQVHFSPIRTFRCLLCKGSKGRILMS